MDRGVWQAIVHRVTESDMTEATQHACTKHDSAFLNYVWYPAFCPSHKVNSLGSEKASDVPH